MKKSFSFLVIIFLLIAVSCRDQMDNQPVSQEASSSSNIVKFNTSEEFKNMANKFSKMTPQELDAWEKGQGFTSLRSIISKANQEWESLNTAEEKNSLLNKYADVLSLKDERLTPTISISFYQSIANREGFYEVNGTLNKVLGDYIILGKTDDYLKMKNIKTIEGKPGKTTFEKDGLKVVKYRGLEYNPNARTQSNCANYMEAEYFDNPSGCKNDRRVYLSASLYIVVYGDQFYPFVDVKVWGRKRSGTTCNWSDYATRLSYTNVNFTVIVDTGNGSPSTVTRTLPDYSTIEDAYSITHSENLGGGTLGSFMSYYFEGFYGEGSSRGTPSGAAVIYCY